MQQKELGERLGLASSVFIVTALALLYFKVYGVSDVFWGFAGGTITSAYSIYELDSGKVGKTG